MAAQMLPCLCRWSSRGSAISSPSIIVIVMSVVHQRMWPPKEGAVMSGSACFMCPAEYTEHNPACNAGSEPYLLPDVLILLYAPGYSVAIKKLCIAQQDDKCWA